MRKGKIIEPAECNIRDHERRTAKAIASTGLIVEFMPEKNQDYTKSPDLLINDVRWEMKSPKTANMSQIERNLKRANKQSSNIIIDSQRIKGVPDKKIQDYLISKLRTQKTIKKLVFINRNREVVDLTKLI